MKIRNENDFHKHKDQKNIPTRFHDESLFEPLRDGGSHRRCPSATQHVTPPAAVPTRDNADDGREGKDEQPPLPSITGGTLCASNGPLQNPQSEVLLIKNKPKTMHHKNQRIQKPGVVLNERACGGGKFHWSNPVISWIRDPLRCISLTRAPPVSLRRVVYLQCSPDYKRLEGSGVVHLSGPSFFPAACPRRMGRR